jgi:uncharacterized protein YfbU (UPF0304 family)
MGQLSITLPDDLELEIREQVGQGKYGSVSDFARDAFKGQLSNRPGYWERFIAVQVLENNKLLKRIADDGNWGGEELLSALTSGYVGDYHLAEELVYNDVLPVEGSEFVHNVLGMYGELQRSFDQSDNKDKDLARDVVFMGFDGNAGDRYLGYCNFLVDNGNYTYVRPLDKSPHLNSHSMVNDIYRRMLEVYKPIKAARRGDVYKPLSLEEVKQVVAAQIHPDNRPHQTSNNW